MAGICPSGKQRAPGSAPAAITTVQENIKPLHNPSNGLLGCRIELDILPNIKINIPRWLSSTFPLIRKISAPSDPSFVSSLFSHLLLVLHPKNLRNCMSHGNFYYKFVCIHLHTPLDLIYIYYSYHSKEKNLFS